nr:integrase, catalytic region, zinc finger, CCHC-type, peptidase aspartic, catalytic [Tanacetum cinerariifolium]
MAVAMLSMRVKRFHKKTRRRLEFNGKEPVCFDKNKVECFNYHRRGHFARDCRSAMNSGNRSRDVGNARYKERDNGKRPAKEEDEQALVVQDGLGTYDWSYQVEEEATDFALMAFTSNPSSSSSSNSKEEVTETVFDNHSSDEENSVANDRLKKGKGYHAVPPPLTGNYMPPKPDLSFAGLDDSIYKFKISETVTSLAKDEKDAPETSTACVEKPKEDRSSAPLIKDWETDSDDYNVFTPEPIPAKIDFMKAGESVKPVESVKHVKPVTPVKTAEQTKKSMNFSSSPKVDRKNWNVSAAKPKAAALTSATKPVNTVGPKQSVNFSRTIISAIKGNGITAVKTLAVCIWRPRVNAIDQLCKDNRWICTHGHPHQALKNKGIVNSGCSRHMTGNKAYLADYQEIHDGAILLGADNRPPMLEKDTYDSWKSRMELYILNRQHGRMILESVENGPLLWSTIEENGVTRLKKYSGLSAMEAIQADCDYASQVQSSTPLSITYPSNDFQSSVNQNVYNPSSSIPQVEYAPSVHQQSVFSQPDTRLVVPVFQKGDDPIDAINHMMSFLTAVVTSRYPPTNNQLETSSNPRQQATINNGRVTIQPIQGRQNYMTADAYDYDCDEINSAKIALMVKLSHYGFDNLAEEHNQDNVTNNVIYQDVQATSTFEQSNSLNQSKTEITSDSNIISYSQYMNESQYTTVYNSSSPTQQDDLILYVIEQLKNQVVNYTKINQDNKHVNEILTVELERYKNKVRILNEQNNVDKASASCAQSLEIKNLKHTLSEHLKEKESLEQNVTLLKNDFQKEESQNIDRELALEKQVKELNNIMFKRNQSTQTVHILTKPQFFYDHSTRQALGFQNPCYLKKAQQLEPKLYDGSVTQKTNAIVIPDSEETLMLKDESRFKMLQKQKDPIMSEKKVNTKPVDYAALNQLLKDFETRFVPQTELSTEQAFCMVNSSLKKLKFHLARFDMVVKERTTAIAITKGTWGFEQSKACFRDEIIPFVKALKELFNSFDQFLIDELTEVQNVFNQMERAVEQHCVEKNKIQDKMKDVLKENERLLEEAISTDLVNIVVNANVNYACKAVNESERCVTIKTELQRDFINKECYDKLFRKYTILEKHDISLEVDTQLKQEIFQRNNLFLQQKRLKSLSGNVKEDKIKKELEEIKTINIELDHRVTKLVAKNEHLKQTYKQLYDSIKSSCVRSKEQCDNLIKQVNIKSAENSDLNLINFVQKFLGMVKFENDHVAKIMGYGDYKIGNATISRVYFVEGLGHNLFSIGQFYDSDLEVAFRQHTCFIRNLDGVDLLTGSRGNNLYTLSLKDMMASSPICLLSKASKTKSWLWHRRLSHLNFEAMATACYTENRSIIRLRHGKTPYELLHNKLPDLSFLLVFGALCYPTNDSENLGKLQLKANIGIFMGYAPTKKAFRTYNKRTRQIVKTIHVDFDELTAMASEQSSSGPALNEMIPATISSRLV